MRFTMFGAALLLAASPIFAQQSQEKTYNLPVSNPANPVMLEVEIRHGQVMIQGGENDNVEIVARTRPLNEEELANVRRNNWNWSGHNNTSKSSRSREGLTPVRNAMFNMEIEQDGNNIEISSEKSTYYVDLVVNVPQRTNVEAEIRGGGIIVSDTIGYLEVESYRGDIVAERVRGPIVAETHQSSIVVSFADFSDASPSSLTTHSGDIDITVAPSMSAIVNVQNYQGEILSGLDVPFNPTEQVKRNEDSDRREIIIGGQLTATLNQGGQELTLITYSGDVYVRKP